MATDQDQSINELLAEAAEALAEAGFRTGDFGTARDLAEKARDEAARACDLAGHAQALSCLGMVAHYENITRLMGGSKPSSADIDSEEKLFRQALLRWQELAERRPGKAGTADAGPTDAGATETGTADAGPTDAGTTETGTADAGPTDAGTTETGTADAGQTDAGTTDADNAAAGTAEAGSADADATDAGTADDTTAAETDAASTVDASSVSAGTAQALFGLGLVFQVLHNDWITAMPYFWQALDLVSKPDAGADPYLRSEVHRHVGFYFLAEAEQPAQAVRHLQLSLDLREELADPRRIPSGLQALGLAELSAGNSDRAVELLTRAVAEARAAGLSQHRIEDAEKDLREAGGTPDDQTGPASADAASADAASADAAEPGETDSTESGS